MISLICQKNDIFRSTFLGCRVILTDGVASSVDQERILTAVRSFGNFTSENDPHCEHDFAMFEVNGERYFFKIDYLDKNYEFFQEDGRRVITIGCACEY
jgi:hypothetical protein